MPSFTLECFKKYQSHSKHRESWMKPRIMLWLSVMHSPEVRMLKTGECIILFYRSITWINPIIPRWGPLMGRGKAFDANRLFICANTLGSPYGSASPVTINVSVRAVVQQGTRHIRFPFIFFGLLVSCDSLWASKCTDDPWRGPALRAAALPCVRQRMDPRVQSRRVDRYELKHYHFHGHLGQIIS